MHNGKFHRARLLFLFSVLAGAIAAGCGGGEEFGDIPKADTTQQPTAVVAPTNSNPRPTNTLEHTLTPQKPTNTAARTPSIAANPTKTPQVIPTQQAPPAPKLTSTPQPTSTPLPSATALDGEHEFVGVTAGEFHTCLLSNDRAVLCSGMDNTTEENPFPSPAVALESISSGGNHACGWTGTAWWCAGDQTQTEASTQDGQNHWRAPSHRSVQVSSTPAA